MIFEERENELPYAPLDQVEMFYGRFVSYPNEHAPVAHTLWTAHTHLQACAETTPRLAFMSPEKASGKTRALEVTALLVKEPICSLNASPASVVRLIANGEVSLVLDEVDALFINTRAVEGNADLIAILNGGYRAGAKVHRCVTRGKAIEVESFSAFCPVVLAGLRTLPDTLASRAIFIRMRRRAPDEVVEPYRHRIHSGQAKGIYDSLVEWCAENAADLTGAEPELPSEITDRTADCWEPLIAIADAAGGDWPERARAAAIYLTKSAETEMVTTGVELLEHCWEAFGDQEKLTSKALLQLLLDRDESPWADMRGKPMNERLLAKMLKPYGIKSGTIRESQGGRPSKGYYKADFADSWNRYLPSIGERNKRYKRYNSDNQINNVTAVRDVTATNGPEGPHFKNELAPTEADGGNNIDNKNNNVTMLPPLGVPRSRALTSSPFRGAPLMNTWTG
jgi:hypothetical protein